MTALSLPESLLARDGVKLALRQWPLSGQFPTRGVALLVHGLGEHAGRYEHVARFFNERGWNAVAYDQRGHGLSEGQRGGLSSQDDLLHDLSSVIDAVRRAAPGQRLLLLGHSMGGLVVGRHVAALADPLENTPWRRPVDLCVLSSPALDIGINLAQKGLLNSIGRLTPDVALGNGLKPEWICNATSVVQAYVADPLVHDRITGRFTRFMLDAAEVVFQRASQWTVPTLLLYAGSDRCVRPAGSQRFGAATAHRPVTPVNFAHMAHEIFNEPDQLQVFGELDRWLQLQG